MKAYESPADSAGGFFIALIPPLLIALLDSGWVQALCVLAGWWMDNVVFDNVPKPKFMKEGLDIPLILINCRHDRMEVLPGLVRAILAIPLTTAVVRLARLTGTG